MEALLGDYECVHYARRVDPGNIYYTIVEARRLTEVEIRKFNIVYLIFKCSKSVLIKDYTLYLVVYMSEFEHTC